MKVIDKMIELRFEILLEVNAQRMFYITNPEVYGDERTRYDLMKSRGRIEEEIGQTLTEETAFLGFSTILAKHLVLISNNESLRHTEYKQIISELSTINDMVVDYATSKIENNEIKSLKIRKIIAQIKHFKKMFGVDKYLQFLRLFFNYTIEDNATSTIVRNLLIGYLVVIEQKDIVGFDDVYNKAIYGIEYNQRFGVFNKKAKYVEFKNTTEWVCAMAVYSNANIEDTTGRLLGQRGAIRKSLLKTVKNELDKQLPKLKIVFDDVQESDSRYMVDLAVDLANTKYHLTIIPCLYLNRNTLDKVGIYASPDLNRDTEFSDPVIKSLSSMFRLKPDILLNREFVIPASGMRCLLKEIEVMDFKELYLQEYHQEDNDIHKLIVGYKHNELLRTIVLDLKDITTMLYTITTEVDVLALTHVFKILGIWEEYVGLINEKEKVSEVFEKSSEEELTEIQSALEGVLDMVNEKLLGDYKYEEPYNWNFKSNSKYNPSEKHRAVEVEKIIQIDRFTRRLPEGYHASEDAQEYARKYAINLDGKTIVRPFLRKSVIKLK